ncbi:MAG: hypothetical protein ACRCX2_02835 [Paraclostridium sp.]
MNDKGFSIEEYLKLKAGLTKNIKYASNFSKENLENYKVLLNKFKDSVELKKNSKGKLLEELVSFIFTNIDLFEIHENIHTSTNEIDQLIILSDLGKLFKSDGQIDIKSEYMLCECKNYSKKVGVTWVGKFCNLLEEQPARIGVIFSYHGFAGVGKWDSAKGLCKKFYYRKENYNEKMYVIDFNISDFDKLAEGVSFLDILSSKVEALETDTKYEHFISKHPAQL